MNSETQERLREITIESCVKHKISERNFPFLFTKPLFNHTRKLFISLECEPYLADMAYKYFEYWELIIRKCKIYLVKNLIC